MVLEDRVGDHAERPIGEGSLDPSGSNLVAGGTGEVRMQPSASSSPHSGQRFEESMPVRSCPQVRQRGVRPSGILRPIIRSGRVDPSRIVTRMTRPPIGGWWIRANGMSGRASLPSRRSVPIPSDAGRRCSIVKSPCSTGRWFPGKVCRSIQKGGSDLNVIGAPLPGCTNHRTEACRHSRFVADTQGSSA